MGLKLDIKDFDGICRALTKSVLNKYKLFVETYGSNHIINTHKSQAVMAKSILIFPLEAHLILIIIPNFGAHSFFSNRFSDTCRFLFSIFFFLYFPSRLLFVGWLSEKFSAFRRLLAAVACSGPIRIIPEIGK